MFRSKLQSLFPRTSFGGGMTLSEAGFDLLSRLLHMCPEKVQTSDCADLLLVVCVCGANRISFHAAYIC